MELKPEIEMAVARVRGMVELEAGNFRGLDYGLFLQSLGWEIDTLIEAFQERQSEDPE